MAWVDEYDFTDPFVDLRRQASRALALQGELAREIGEGHALFNRPFRVVAEGIPQDDVVVVTDDEVFVVHLTWSGHVESPPWPATEPLVRSEDLVRLAEFRY